MKNTRLLSLLLALVMVLGLMSGCGSTSSTSSAESQTTNEDSAQASEQEEAEEAETPAEEEGEAQAEAEPETETTGDIMEYPVGDGTQTISYWFAYGSDLTNYLPNFFDDSESFQASIEATGVNVEFTYVSGTAAEDTFQLMIATGDYPDILDNAIDRYTTGAEGAVDDEIIIDLSDLLETCMPDYLSKLQANTDVLKDITTDGGYIAGVYTIYNETRDPDAGPIIRQDWLDELGLDTPVTYEDYENVLLAFKSAYGCSSALGLSTDAVPENNYLVAGYGVAGKTKTEGSSNMPFYVVDGEVKYGIIEDGFYDYIEMIARWYSEGLISADYSTADNGDIESLVLTNDCGLWYSGSGGISMMASMADDPDFHAVAIADAVLEEGDTNHFSTVTNYNQPVSISTNAEDPELCAKWLNFWFTEYGSQLANYGIEGVSCTITNGTPDFSEAFLESVNTTGYKESLYLYTVTCVPYYDYVNRDMVTYTSDVAEAASIWASNRDNEYNYPSTASLTAEENEEFTSMYSDIATVISEKLPGFVMGTTPLEEWDSFVQTLIDLGIEDCIALKQAAYDRYLAR